jgi:hypothetical protein
LLVQPELHNAHASAVLDHSLTLPQGDGVAGPPLAGSEIGGERNLIVLDASDVLYDAFAVRRPAIDAEGEVSSRCGHYEGPSSERTASPLFRAPILAEDLLPHSVSECKPNDQSDCSFEH